MVSGQNRDGTNLRSTDEFQYFLYEYELRRVGPGLEQYDLVVLLTLC